MNSCYKCKFCKQDTNDIDFWYFCSNSESPNHYEDIENIDECIGTHWELMDEYPLCRNCIYNEGCHSTIFGEDWTCSKKHPKASDIESNAWNWFEENEEIVECEFYVKGEPLINVVLG